MKPYQLFTLPTLAEVPCDTDGLPLDLNQGEFVSVTPHGAMQKLSYRGQGSYNTERASEELRVRIIDLLAK